MTNRVPPFRSGVLFVLLVLCCLLGSTGYAEEADLSKRVDALDAQYQKLLRQFHQSNTPSVEVVGDIDLLAEGVSSKIAQHPIQAIRLLVANFDTVKANPDHPSLAGFAALLLQQNHRQYADKLYNLVEDSGSDTNLAYLKFHLAKYYARLQQWQRVGSLIKNTFSELSGDDSDYAFLLQGSALQHLRQHRLSQQSYAKIPESSKFYVHAQLNTALAHIRQGWITDARRILQELAPISRKRKDKELTYRIFTLLGYALLQKEYFRDAREAFRQVNLESQYTNKALFGIALTAVSQSDYVGSLNALKILKQQQTLDLNVDEAYLLLPYIYERLNESELVANSFNDAIGHYQLRLIELNTLKQVRPASGNLLLEVDTGKILLGSSRLPFGRLYPTSIVTNRNNLEYLAATNSSSKLTSNLNQLLSAYNQLLAMVVDRVIERQKEFISSYLNQSRYGLARHYDNQQQGKQQ